MSVPRKIVIIGAGHVGAQCGFALMIRGEADELVFIDIDEKKAACQALDLADAVAWLPHRIVVRTGDYSDCRDADIVVLAVGVPRKPGQTRLDLFDDSLRMVQSVAEPLNRSGFGGIFISITNPAEIVCDYMRKRTQSPQKQNLQHRHRAGYRAAASGALRGNRDRPPLRFKPLCWGNTAIRRWYPAPALPSAAAPCPI